MQEHDKLPEKESPQSDGDSDSARDEDVKKVIERLTKKLKIRDITNEMLGKSFVIFPVKPGGDPQQEEESPEQKLINQLKQKYGVTLSEEELRKAKREELKFPHSLMKYLIEKGMSYNDAILALKELP